MNTEHESTAVGSCINNANANARCGGGYCTSVFVPQYWILWPEPLIMEL